MEESILYTRSSRSHTLTEKKMKISRSLDPNPPKISVFDTEWGRGLDEQISGCSFLTRAVKHFSLPSIDTARDVLQARAAQNDFFPPLEPPEGTWAAHGQSVHHCSPLLVVPLSSERAVLIRSTLGGARGTVVVMVGVDKSRYSIIQSVGRHVRPCRSHKTSLLTALDQVLKISCTHTCKIPMLLVAHMVQRS